MDYEKYLRTSHWQEIRLKIHLRDKVCQYCGEKRGLQVHHKTYKRVGHEKLSDLILLCDENHSGCHYRAHRMGEGIRHWRPDDVIMSMWCWFKKNYRIEDR